MPGVAARRAESRIRLEALNSYRGSVRSRTSTQWDKLLPYNNGSPQSRLDIIEMRDRAFSVYENNPIAKSILNTELTNVVADGYRLQAKALMDDGKTPAKDWNNEAEDKWENFLENADVRGIKDGSKIQRDPYRSCRRDGIGGFILVDQGGFSKLQYVPASKIQTPDDQIGNINIPSGVEVNDSLAPIAFHILDMNEYGKRTFTRVPANNFVYLMPEVDDDLGVVGPPCYSTIFKLLDQTDGYIDGVAIAARMATVFGLMIKSDTAAADFRGLKLIAGAGTNASGSPQMQRALTLEDGSIKLLGSKDDVVQVNAQQPMQQTADFIRALLRLIGMPFDMPLELIAHDMSTVTFASARIGLLQYYRASYARQRWYKSKWSRIYRWWSSREAKRQQLGLPGAFVTPFPQQYFPHSLHARAWSYTDPVRDPQSDWVQMDMGVKSLQQICSERGTDHDEVQAQQSASLALRRLLNLPTDIHCTLSRDVIKITGNDPAAVAGEDAGTPEANDKADGYSYDDGENENAGV